MPASFYVNAGSPGVFRATTSAVLGGGGGGGSLKLWLKADVGVTYNGSNEVSAWADQSGNGNNLGSPVGPPIYNSSLINGLPAIDFISGKRLTGTNIVIAKTIYAVVKTSSEGPPTAYSAILEASGGSLYSAISGNQWGSYFNGSYSAGENLGASTVSIIGTISDDGVTYSFRRNGAQISSGSNGGGFYLNRSALYVGSDGSGGQDSGCYIAEVLVYNYALSVGECETLENTLNSKYAVY